MNAADIQQLKKLIALQINASAAERTQSATAPAAPPQSLAEMMYEAATQGDRLLSISMHDTVFRQLMDNYHTGIGYEAYRHAQDLGIVQRWAKGLPPDDSH